MIAVKGYMITAKNKTNSCMKTRNVSKFKKIATESLEEEPDIPDIRLERTVEADPQVETESSRLQENTAQINHDNENLSTPSIMHEGETEPRQERDSEPKRTSARSSRNTNPSYCDKRANNKKSEGHHFKPSGDETSRE